MSVLLQISDPHFGTEQAPVMEALAALVQRERPDLLLLSGDITQRAQPEEFAAARAFVNRLGVPLLAIPGNHDIPLLDLRARCLQPYANHRAAFGDNLEPEHVASDLLVLCVNTTRPWRHKNGAVSAAQIERVATRLERASAAQLRVVVVHQPAAVLRAQDRHDRLRGSAAALARWAAAGADLVMGGHIHLPYVMALPGLARPLWAVQAGTAVSSRVREGIPNSVNIVRWEPGRGDGGCAIEQWDHAATAAAFVCARVTRVAPERSGHAR